MEHGLDGVTLESEKWSGGSEGPGEPQEGQLNTNGTINELRRTGRETLWHDSLWDDQVQIPHTVSCTEAVSSARVGLGWGWGWAFITCNGIHAIERMFQQDCTKKREGPKLESWTAPQLVG